MSSDITIVTAFFDLGREKWTPENGYTKGFQRTTSVYLDRFATLASLNNELVVYTSPDLVPEVAARRKGKESSTKIIPFPFFDLFKEEREAIQRIQQTPSFINLVNPIQRLNPERISPNYILLTNLKSYFVTHAIQNGFVKDDQAAWVDFGYFRSAEALAGSERWQYAFEPEKIHLFAFCRYHGEIFINDIVGNNIAYIVGGCVVAQKKLWPALTMLTKRASQELAARSMVDNDQTLFLLASLYRPDLFDIHLVGPEGWWEPFLFFNINAKK
jgi:protein YibB